MNPGKDDTAARRAELGTVVAIYNVRPDWYEGEWPEEPPRAMALVKWPGHKKLTFEPLASLIQVQL